MNKKSLLAECHDLALAVAPELQSRPLYVLDSAELDDPRGEVYGWANSDFIDYGLAAKLGDRWTAPGPVIALDLAAIEEAAKPGGATREYALSIMLHETSHVLPGSEPIGIGLQQPTPKFLKWEREQVAASLGADIPLSLDIHHDSRFIRRCAHLYVRACAAKPGTEFPMAAVINPMPPRLENYLPLLLGECVNMLGASFSEIEKLPMPAAVAEQFKLDLDFRKRFGL